MTAYTTGVDAGAASSGVASPAGAGLAPQPTRATIKEMVAGGYIECVPEVIDGRQRKVCHLTPKGKDAYKAAARVWSSVLPYLQFSVNEAGIELSPADDCCGDAECE